MANVALNDQDGVLRSISDLPPTHYAVKIKSFSLLSKNDIDKYYSGEFEAGGYKWKLVVCPNGKNVKEYLSVYLAMTETTSLRPGWEVFATFRLFLLDQNKDNYLTVEASSGKGRRFHGMKLEWGFDQFIHTKAFSDAVNGYLVEDSCVFGAEVFICKETSRGKAECLSMIKEAITYKHTWKVEEFWKLDQLSQESKAFNGGGYKWKILMYPNGKGNEFTLRVLDLLQGRHISGKASRWFRASDPESGWPRYITLDYLYLPKNGLLMKDSCTIEAELTIHGVANVV
ncbi:TNF receptor-associated factor-like [Heracleum sosnowskyi]|uniref:TNF receptor-associated factor-like n=1 Tax=Heracleum sosnowskyi TaxID=360622 RepID=A0AAD8ILY0_9APIA|nr:TNF receptor-associated factor-like [Heracleum sosnowskyi]